MLLLAQIAFFVVAFVAAYVCWIRPVLHSRPALKSFYDQAADGFWSAFRLRFAGIKTLLVAAVGMAASAIVALHDFLLPYAVGIDWTPITDMIPKWAIPLILFMGYALIGYFRKLTDRRRAEGL
jgi:hypothetical protein